MAVKFWPEGTQAPISSDTPSAKKVAAKKTSPTPTTPKARPAPDKKEQQKEIVHSKPEVSMGLITWRWGITEDGEHVAAAGRVKNVSSEILYDVEVYAYYYNSNVTLILTNNVSIWRERVGGCLLRPNSIYCSCFLPGELADFTITTEAPDIVPGIAMATLGFKKNTGFMQGVKMDNADITIPTRNVEMLDEPKIPFIYMD